MAAAMSHGAHHRLRVVWYGDTATLLAPRFNTISRVLLMITT